MEKFLSRFNNHGKFVFGPKDSLKGVSKDVPNRHGVYYILKQNKSQSEVVYIGSSGRIDTEGIFPEQGLRGRINNKQNKSERREVYFRNQINKNDLEYLIIKWHVTIDDKNSILPSYAEAVLIQNFYEENKQLPKWNKSF